MNALHSCRDLACRDGKVTVTLDSYFLSALFLVISTLCPSVIGCGSNTSLPVTPLKGDSCTGVSISGVLQDSLTSQPVHQGWAFLESGTQISGTPISSFVVIQQTATDANGNFTLCTTSTAILSPSVVVLVALDSPFQAYPPFVAPVPQSGVFGTVFMGGCRVQCAFAGQQQTSSPVTISGVVTTSPVSKNGAIFPQYAMNAPDGSAAIWNLAMPTLDAKQSFTFTTQSSGCNSLVSFCTAYSFTLPSQNAVSRVNGVYSQQSGEPIYSIMASVTGTPACVPPSLVIRFQQDEKSDLEGTPGVELIAAPINFKQCQ